MTFQGKDDIGYLKKRFWGKLTKHCDICNDLIPLTGPNARQGSVCGKPSCRRELKRRRWERRKQRAIKT